MAFEQSEPFGEFVKMSRRESQGAIEREIGSGDDQSKVTDGSRVVSVSR
jgi:hypothetical protein